MSREGRLRENRCWTARSRRHVSTSARPVSASRRSSSRRWTSALLHGRQQLPLRAGLGLEDGEPDRSAAVSCDTLVEAPALPPSRCSTTPAARNMRNAPPRRRPSCGAMGRQRMSGRFAVRCRNGKPEEESRQHLLGRYRSPLDQPRRYAERLRFRSRRFYPGLQQFLVLGIWIPGRMNEPAVCCLSRPAG